MHEKRRRSPFFLLAAIFFAAALALAAAPGKRVRLAPKYAAGQSLRYRIESRIANSGKTTTPILNPEGGTESTLLTHLVIRLDVLSAPAAPTSGAVRFRATCEKSSAESETDAFDPAQPAPSAEYARLEGRSIEFTLAPGGQLVDVQGLDDLGPARSAAESALSWLNVPFSTSGLPAAGIELGQKWKSERPVDGAPLAGLTWRVESTYLRDESCGPADDAEKSSKPGAAAQSCAVILSRFEIARTGSPHSDATTEDYLRNGLRVSGSWTGSGESLDYVSLSTGLLVRSTQTSDQQMDYQITSASNGSSVHRKGQIHAQSEIALVPPARSARQP